MIHFILGFAVGVLTLTCSAYFLEVMTKRVMEHNVKVIEEELKVEDAPKQFDGSAFLDPEIKAYFDMGGK